MLQRPQFLPGDTLKTGDILKRGGAKKDDLARWIVLDPPYWDKTQTLVHARLTNFTGGKANRRSPVDGSFEQELTKWETRLYHLTIDVSAEQLARQEAINLTKESHDYYTQLTAITLEK